MIEPLRRRRSDGALYRRRAAVEKELEELDRLELAHVVSRARAPQTPGADAVSSEALMHILRRAVRSQNTDGPTAGPIDALTETLTRRCATILAHQLGGYDEVARKAIAADVIDRAVDAVVDNGDVDDYAEVNFNDWLKHRRLDAARKHTTRIRRFAVLGDAVEDLADDETRPVAAGDEGSDDRTPEALYALKEAREKATLPPCIEATHLSPDDQYRVAAMIQKASLPPNTLEAFLAYHYLGVPIESSDPDQYTLVKHFGKSEKTIRLWIKHAEGVFVRLRETSDGR